MTHGQKREGTLIQLQLEPEAAGPDPELPDRRRRRQGRRGDLAGDPRGRLGAVALDLGAAGDAEGRELGHHPPVETRTLRKVFAREKGGILPVGCEMEFTTIYSE